MFSTPFTPLSIKEATDDSITLALAPGYEAVTDTCTGVISGYFSNFKLKIASKPKIVINIEITNANLGRFIKKYVLSFFLLF